MWRQGNIYSFMAIGGVRWMLLRTLRPLSEKQKTRKQEQLDNVTLKASRAALILQGFLTTAFCERVSGCCPAPRSAKGSASGQALAMTLHRQAGQKLNGV